MPDSSSIIRGWLAAIVRFRLEADVGIAPRWVVAAMSDNWLQLIPHDPEFQPSIVSAEAARRLLASFVPDADEINATFKPTKEFFHPGGNWSGVRCPVCNADIEEGGMMQ